MPTTNNLTAIVKDPHSISLYTVADGMYKGTLYITNGNIIGQPITSADSVVVTYNEGGFNYMNTYKLPSLQFKSKIKL